MAQAGSAQRASSHDALVTGLGWFSLGLGLVEFLSPRRVAGSLGMADRTTLVQTYGLREMIAGLGVLLSRNPTAWLWARAAGDAFDMAAVAPQVISSDKNVRQANRIAAFAVAVVSVLDVYSALKTR
jgi:hypothetical protein